MAGALLLLAALVAFLALLFGNAYASKGHGHGAEHAEDHAVGGEEHEHEAAEEGDHVHEATAGGSGALKITESLVISVAGVALVPFAFALMARRPRDHALGEESTVEIILRAGVALLSTGASLIHFVVLPAHWSEYWAYGLFFLVSACAQMLWALWVILAPSRPLYLAGAVGNAAIVALWVVTRTAGIPLGPSAGESEAAQFADVASTVFEALLVIGALALARRHGAQAQERQSRSAVSIATGLAVVVAAVTAASVISLVEL
jgi:hypothetical protein